MWPDPARLDRLIAEAMGGDAEQAARRWAASGAMALTGPVDGPADVGPARVALAMDALAADISHTSAAVGQRVEVDGAALLGERAAIAGLVRQGLTSCGGATRLLRAGDGAAIALSLARDDDRDLLPALHALLGIDPTPARETRGMRPGRAASTALPPHRAPDDGHSPGGAPAHGDAAVRDDGHPARAATEAAHVDDDWAAITVLASRVDGAEFVGAAAELGLPAGRCGETTADRELIRWSPNGPRRPIAWPPVVVDLSSLWAGPLCANLLGLAGARVVKVESSRRPDGARCGPPAFFDLMHGGHESVALDLSCTGGRAALRHLLGQADVVIEASRPRALAAMGASYDELAATGWRGTWLSITGHGRDGAAADRVAFGDDAAVAGGLVGDVRTGGAGRPEHGARQRHGAAGWFVADAIADPATGLLGAAAVSRALAGGHRGLIEVSLATTAAHLARGVAAHPRAALPAGVRVAAPHARAVTARAPTLGAHDETWRR